MRGRIVFMFLSSEASDTRVPHPCAMILSPRCMTWSRHSAWTGFVRLSALPFQLRAAWIAARLGKPMLPSYKARFAKPYDAMELREAGWGLVAMGLRHQGRAARFGGRSSGEASTRPRRSGWSPW